jgi:hypothetical protein
MGWGRGWGRCQLSQSVRWKGGEATRGRSRPPMRRGGRTRANTHVLTKICILERMKREGRGQRKSKQVWRGWMGSRSAAVERCRQCHRWGGSTTQGASHPTRRRAHPTDAVGSEDIEPMMERWMGRQWSHQTRSQSSEVGPRRSIRSIRVGHFHRHPGHRTCTSTHERTLGNARRKLD